MSRASFGEGTNIKQFLTDNKDFSVAKTSKISKLRLKDIQSTIQRNISKGTNKKEITDSEKLSILEQLDLQCDISPTNKLYKSL